MWAESGRRSPPQSAQVATRGPNARVCQLSLMHGGTRASDIALAARTTAKSPRPKASTSTASSSRPKGKRKRAANRAPNSAGKTCGGVARTTYARRRGPAQRMAGPQISIPCAVTSTICAASQDPDHPRKTLDANLPEGATPGGVLAHSRASARRAGMHGAAANILAIAARCVRTTVLHGHRPNQTSRATARTPKEECSA